MTAEGRTLGVYRVLERIGAGGMGEVYRARDTRLGRDVAVKLLSGRLTNVPESRARFEREALVLAALNHPNIAAIYGLEDTTDQGPLLQGIVLELVEGDTLADRIRRGPLALKDALTLAAPIADALESAHGRGVVHRDLTPANIKITAEGIVKVLDFGLAKVADPAVQPEDITHAPTIVAAGTREGVIVGTTPYMSPEQARGDAVDQRTDVWAFGCVLYEMLTGRAAFRRPTTAETLSAVLEREPDWSALPAATPPLVVRLLRRCLEKDARRRFHHVADIRLDLEEALSGSTPARSSAVGAHRRLGSRWMRPIAVGALAVAALAAVWWYWPSPEANVPTRLSISVSGAVTPQTSVDVSPDGRRLAYVSTDASGRSMLWVRALDSLEPRALAGTEDAAHPFWSPDGRSLAFLAGGRLKRIDLDGGSVLTLAETNTRSGVTWGRGGVILFSPRAGQLATVPAGGGPVAAVRQRIRGVWPFFLPDGRHYLFFGRDEKSTGIYVGSLDTDEARLLVASNYKGAYADPGFLLFIRGETLMAQPFDARRRELSGEPVAIAENIWTALAAGQASFSSARGVLAYVNASLWNRELKWFDRAGRLLGSLAPAARYVGVPQISPDARRVAIARGRIGAEDVWLIDQANGSDTRATLGASADTVPVWATDGRRLLYQAASAQGIVLTLAATDRATDDVGVATLDPNAHLWDWSRDGRFVVYSTFGRKLAADLWVQPMTGERTPYAFAESAFHKTQAQISPNGRWLAYTSYETGRDEVYVESFPTPRNRRQVSVDGGMQPRWRDDGRELFYLRSDQHLMAVPLAVDQTPAGAPAPLFRTRLVPQGSQSVWFDIAYDVTPDGQRFLMLDLPNEPSPPIGVVLDWQTATNR